MKMSMKVIEDRGGGLGRKAKLCVHRVVGRHLQGREKAQREVKSRERKERRVVKAMDMMMVMVNEDDVERLW